MTRSRSAPNLPRLPQVGEEWNAATARELTSTLQTWLKHTVLYTSEFYEARWSSIKIMPQDLILRGVSDPTFTALLGNTYGYNFADAASNEVFFTIEVPESWAGGDTLYPYVRWSPSDTGVGTVRWELEYTLAKDGAVFPATATLTGETAGTGVDNAHIKTDISSTGIDITDQDIGLLIPCRLIRNGAHANDTYTAAAALHSIGFAFLVDSLGAEHVFAKNF
tara:strand:+ start:1552 stop:2217 length:666 start_codon:yes stop_codon:yes gene_type:complete